MLNIKEDIRNEFKIKLTDNLEKVVNAFLNTEGGNIYIGVNDKGDIIGLNGNIDLLQRTIKDRIRNNIKPSTLGLFDIVVYSKDNKEYIKIIIAKGYERPYYIKSKGMCPEGCFIRVGSAIEAMDDEMILNLFAKRARFSLKNIKAPHQDLTFKILKIYYEEKGFKINNNFLKKLNLYTLNNEFNYIAYLLSDENDIPILFAKYEGEDVVNLIENEDYGGCCLLKATDNIINKFRLENKTFTKIEVPRRKEIKMYDFEAVREVVINALVHNDWSNGYTPKFEIFANKLVISSNGGIQEGVTQKEFLKGFSNPRNPELMRIFKDMDFVEELGTGIQRVLKTYPESIYEFFPNHIRVTIPFNQNTFDNHNTQEVLDYPELNKTQKEILKLIKSKNNITQEEIANILGLSIDGIKKSFRVLICNKYIKRLGSKNRGYWEILK